MISRTWHGIVPIERKDAFDDYLKATGVKDALRLSGNCGVYTKVVDQADYSHFFLCTIWRTMDDIIMYAGNPPDIAITYPEDDAYGLISDPIVIHQEIVHAVNPFYE